MRILCKQGSLTEGEEKVLVNASNTGVDLGSGVSAAIRAACGPAYQEAIHRALYEQFRGPMEPGEVLITDAGTHPTAKFVAHIAVMDYRPRSTSPSPPDPARIQKACRALWQALEALPQAHRPLSVAMVALGAGVGGLGVKIPTRIACETLKAYRAEGGEAVEEVTFYGYAQAEHLAIQTEVRQHFRI